MSEYVATTDEVREEWCTGVARTNDGRLRASAAFDRWLAAHDAEVAEKIVHALTAVSPVEWALAGQCAGIDAARIAREAVTR